ncbi:hypothetical protein SPFL3102_00718 [Sporomusaceae bacterium FL31]|nr:hypothetical protein SPFL3101_00560 [Sporomusaceae bacterium FL31]GCE32917.1 hypothetical protein SPFL3102_00718 [Sporomusaceae bacterium]
MSSSNEMMTPAEIEALLASMNTEPEPAAPAPVSSPEPIQPSENGMMSPAEIEALLASMNTEPEPVAPAPVSPPEPPQASETGMMSPAEIEALLASMNTEPEPAAPAPIIPPEPPQASENGMMSPAEIEALLASMNTEPEPAAPVPVSPPEPIQPSENGMMSPAEIEALLASMNTEPEQAAPAAVSPPEPPQASENAMMSPAEIEALLASMNTEPEPEKAPQAPIIPAEPPQAAAENVMMSPAEIEALTSMNTKPEVEKAPASLPEPPQMADTGEIISQAEIESLLAGLETNPPSEVPTALDSQAMPELEATQALLSDAQPEAANPDEKIQSQVSPALEGAPPKPSLFSTVKSAMIKLAEKLTAIPLFKKKTGKQIIEAATLTQVPAPQQELPLMSELNLEKQTPALRQRLLGKPLMITGGLLLALLIGFSASLLNATITISSDQQSSSNNPQASKLTAMGIKYLPDELVKYAGRGNKEVTNLFLQAGMSPNSYRISDGFTPLMAAASFGRLEIINFLIEHGADVNAKDKDGQTALMKAVAYNYPQAAKILLQAGADSSTRDTRGNTASSLAAEKKDPEVLKLLPQAAGQPDTAKPVKAEPSEQPVKEPQPEFVLANDKAGYMQIGQSIESLYKLYNKRASSISTVSTPYPEVNIYLDGRSTPSLSGSVSIRNQGKLQLIDGIRIDDERFRTADGIGINSTLGELRRANAFKEIKHIEQSLYAVSTGMAFELAVSLEHIADWLTTGSSSSLPDDIKIQSIILK